MIWNSVPLMTAFDLLIIAVAGYAMWHSRPIGAGRRALAQRFGWLLVTVGLLAVCLFYLADLVSMYVLPETESEQAAMTFMEALHRTLSWPVVLIISFGFVEMLRELQRREARLRRLVDSNIIGVFTWGSDGRIIDANDAFLRIVGYLRDDLVSGRLRWRDLTPAEWRDLDARAVAEVRTTGTVQPFEKEYFRKDGSRVPVLIGATSFEGTRDQGVAFVIDLTERKRAEENLRESERRYREAQMELAHTNRVTTMGQLTASISHEVKQPLAGVVTNASTGLRWLAHEPPSVEEARNALGRIIKDCTRAAEVIDRIRALVKKVPPRKELLEINQIILEVIDLTRSEADRNRVALQPQLSSDLPLVSGDRIQLQQVILNLIINAIEAMSGVDEESRDLRIGTREDASNSVLVEVWDSGPGLNPESLDRLFDAFHTTKPGGMGMGLSICRSIVEAHGGRLWATASEPRGATFIFTLPARAEGAPDSRAAE